MLIYIKTLKPLRYSVNSLYNKCEILKFGDLPTTLCAGITLLDSKHSQITRNQKGNQVNIPTVRTKTSGSNSIKSKSVNTWNDLNREVEDFNKNKIKNSFYYLFILCRSAYNTL